MPTPLYNELTANLERLDKEIAQAEALTLEAVGAEEIHRLVDLLAVLRLSRSEISAKLQSIEGEK